jgi:hypothetical protein
LDERPSNRAITRAILRVRKSWMSVLIDRYYRRWLSENSDFSWDLVVVVKAEVVPRWFLEAIREQNQDAHFVFYTFDALKNASNCLQVLDCFDELLSFDPADVDAHDEIDYLPLFYAPEFQPGPRGVEPDLWMSFVGTLHSERYALAQASFSGGSRTLGFFFVQARWFFFILKHVTRTYASVPWRHVAFKPLSRLQIADIFRRSHAVLDVQREGQRGLTMRTFEVLASGAILVTTNEAVRHEPFFSPERVVVVTSDPEALDPADLSRTLAGLSRPDSAPPGFESYSLEAWVARLTSATESEGAAR